MKITPLFFLIYYFTTINSEMCHLLIEYQVKDFQCYYKGYQNNIVSLDIKYEMKVIQTILNENYTIREKPYSEKLSIKKTQFTGTGDFDSCVIEMHLVV